MLLVVACLALATLSLLLPWALAFDPWVWVTWGRDVTRLELNTAGGGAWKPLPVVVTTPLALTGAAAPALWLVVARAGGLLALAGAAYLAYRLAAVRSSSASAGAIAAVVTAAAIALSTWWLFNTALGNSEGLLVAAALWAVAAQLAGRWRAALALGVVAALLRPEVWPFLGLDALWLWRTRRASLGTLAARPRAGAAALVRAGPARRGRCVRRVGRRPRHRQPRRVPPMPTCRRWRCSSTSPSS